MRFPASLHTRLILSHLLVCFVSIILISTFAGNAIFNAANKDIKNNLENLAFAASNTLQAPLKEASTSIGDSTAANESLLRLLANHPDIQYTLFSPDGTPITNSKGETLAKADNVTAPEVVNALKSETGEADSIRLNNQGQQALYLAVQVQDDGQVYGILRLETAIQPALVSARRSLYLLLWVALLVALAVSVFAWFLANNLAHPIQNLTKTAEQLAHGDMGARVEPTGPQELQRLGETFNFMAGRLQDHLVELRSFVANASHELRTPLTVVKLRAEALRNGALNEPVVSEQFLTEIESEVDRLSRMVSDLLDLSRIEAGLASSQRAPLNLGLLATEVYETFKIRAAKAKVGLDLQIAPNLPSIVGNEDQLRRVLYNFVDNAIKYTPGGGHVEIVVGYGRKDASIRLVVKDTGPGIPADHLPHVFERFYRVEATRPRYGSSKGSGLGLAIAKSIVENHGGKIGVSSQLGKGTTFWVELPTPA
jgi:signal transduction histidine kinase